MKLLNYTHTVSNMLSVLCGCQLLEGFLWDCPILPSKNRRRKNCLFFIGWSESTIRCILVCHMGKSYGLEEMNSCHLLFLFTSWWLYQKVWPLWYMIFNAFTFNQIIFVFQIWLCPLFPPKMPFFSPLFL